MGTPGEVKCTRKPIRTVTRRFTSTDVARVYCHAVKQGVSRSEIDRRIEKKCPSGDKECTCAELKQELRNALRVISLAIAIIALTVPVLRVLSTVVVWLKRYRAYRLAQDVEKAAKALEDANKSGRILEGEYERVIERVRELEGAAAVVIKPPA